jgi:hypothetical protein
MGIHHVKNQEDKAVEWAGAKRFVYDRPEGMISGEVGYGFG